MITRFAAEEERDKWAVRLGVLEGALAETIDKRKLLERRLSNIKARLRRLEASRPARLSPSQMARTQK